MRKQPDLSLPTYEAYRDSGKLEELEAERHERYLRNQSAPYPKWEAQA